MLRRCAPFALVLIAALPALAQDEKKTEAKTEPVAKTEDSAVETKSEKEAKVEAAKQVAAEKEKAEKQKALSDAAALSRIDEQIGRLAERVAKTTNDVTAAQQALDAAKKAEAAAKGAVDGLEEAIKKLTADAAAKEKAATEAEAAAKGEKATEAQKKAAIEARAEATKAAKALKTKQEELTKAKAAHKAAAGKLEEATAKLKALEAKLKDVTEKLTSAQQGREAQQRWMTNRLRSDLPKDELEAFLVPLTKDQLVEEAQRWIEKVQSKVAAVSATELWLKRNKDASSEERDKRGQTLVLLQDERAKLVDRARMVLKELAAKGGDKAKIEEYELYLKAVSGLRIQASDARGATLAIWSWLKSDEGGIRWAKNLGKFFLTLLAFWIAGVVAGGTARRALGGARFSVLLQSSISGLLKRIVMLVGLVVALSMLEVNINPLLAALGGAAIVVGLALQGTLANFASGMLIMGYRPFDEGDWIEVGGVTGKVQGLSMLSTTIVTGDNKTVIVPNGSVWNGTIVNLSAKPTRRVDLVFGIGYDDDIAKAHAVLTEIVTAHEQVLKDPEPNIRVSELGDSSVNFIVRPWVKNGDYWGVYWDLMRAVKERFDAEGISIPFPQRDVHVHSAEAAPAPAPSDASATEGDGQVAAEQEPETDAAPEEAAASTP